MKKFQIRVALLTHDLMFLTDLKHQLSQPCSGLVCRLVFLVDVDNSSICSWSMAGITCSGNLSADVTDLMALAEALWFSWSLVSPCPAVS